MVQQDDTRVERVYLIGAEGSSIVKIGRTLDLDRRLPSLQIGSHTTLNVLWTCSGDSGLEQYLHRHFRNQRVSGEWFDLGDDPVGMVKSALVLRPPDRPVIPRQMPDTAQERIRVTREKLRRGVNSGKDPVRVDESVDVRLLTTEECRRFGLPDASPALVVERTYYDDAGHVLEFSTSLLMNGMDHAVSFTPSEEESARPEYQ